MEKHTYGIQGPKGDVYTALSAKLREMAQSQRKRLTVVQIEYPTNPDMKDTDLNRIEAILLRYQRQTQSQVLLLLDTTFSPPSRAAQGFEGVAVMVFTSLSKSVTGGFTTGGSLVANETALAQTLLALAHKHLRLMDTASKACQLAVLARMSGRCAQRVQSAHENCVRASAFFEAAVQRASGCEMRTNFVTRAQIAKGVRPATFSFNLPPPRRLRGNAAELEGFAQRFVDNLCAQSGGGVKPCVSFGQKNSTVYATVPATSTQGVISEEHKRKQALGGVQLVRFSFPTDMDGQQWTAWTRAVEQALAVMYGEKGHIRSKL